MDIEIELKAVGSNENCSVILIDGDEDWLDESLSQAMDFMKLFCKEKKLLSDIKMLF